MRLYRAVASLIVLAACLSATAVRASTPGLVQTNTIAAKVADLKKQLEAGLRARRPAEFAFIAKVVELVESDVLPRKLVNNTFLWARKKKPYPFPYFKRALRILAAKLGISI